MKSSWLGKNNIIDRTQDHHKSELQKERELGSRHKISKATTDAFDYIDDLIGFDIFVIAIVVLIIAIWILFSIYYFQVPFLKFK